MGLDMYAFKRKPGEDQDANKEIDYWRKHPDLHGWMEDLYRVKGGNEHFNCVEVRLTADDLLRLKADVEAAALPHTEGFFFSISLPEEREHDLEFIAKAQQAIDDGYEVYYDSWW